MEEFLKGQAGPVFILLYLLPGFLGAVVYNYLVERDKPSNFDRIIDALLLTLASSLIVHILFTVPLLPSFNVPKDSSPASIISIFLSRNILYISICSVVISIIFACLNNHNVIYDVLNWTKITYKNSNSDVWYDTFYKYRKYWVCIRFYDGRSLVGWPKYYSKTGAPRELFLADATWYETLEDGRYEPIDVVGAGVYISDFSTVIGIELLE